MDELTRATGQVELLSDGEDMVGDPPQSSAGKTSASEVFEESKALVDHWASAVADVYTGVNEQFLEHRRTS